MPIEVPQASMAVGVGVGLRKREEAKQGLFGDCWGQRFVPLAAMNEDGSHQL